MPLSALSRFSGACVLLTTPITATVFRLSSSALGSWSHWCASALHSFSIPLPTHMGISPGSPPSSLHRWLSREVNPRLHGSLRHRLSAMVSDLHGVLVNTLSDNFLPVRENPVYSFNLPPSAFRLWGLARWGHDPSSTGRPSRHRQGPTSCPFCHDTDGSLMHHLSTCPSHHNARTAWAHSCGISPPDVSTLARHGWVFNPVDESNSPQTIRAHIRFSHCVLTSTCVVAITRPYWCVRFSALRQQVPPWLFEASPVVSCPNRCLLSPRSAYPWLSEVWHARARLCQSSSVLGLTKSSS